MKPMWGILAESTLSSTGSRPEARAGDEQDASLRYPVPRGAGLGPSRPGSRSSNPLPSHSTSGPTRVGRVLRHPAHINGLEGFWGYLKRRLAAKGGIRPSRLPLYVAEYVWRYNHRRLSVDEQVHRLLNLLQKRALPSG